MSTFTRTTPASRPAPRDRTHYLYVAVIVAVGLGIAVGLLAPSFAVQLKPLGQAFVGLIKMMIQPVIFCTIVLGVGSVASAARVGKVGGLALVYFITMSTFALAIGLVVGNLIHPGSGLHITGLLADQHHGAAEWTIYVATKIEGPFIRKINGIIKLVQVIFCRLAIIAFTVGTIGGCFVIDIFNICSQKSFLLSYVFNFIQHIGGTANKTIGRLQIIFEFSIRSPGKI